MDWRMLEYGKQDLSLIAKNQLTRKMTWYIVNVRRKRLQNGVDRDDGEGCPRTGNRRRAAPAPEKHLWTEGRPEQDASSHVPAYLPWPSFWPFRMRPCRAPTLPSRSSTTPRESSQAPSSGFRTSPSCSSPASSGSCCATPCCTTSPSSLSAISCSLSLPSCSTRCGARDSKS